MRIAAPERFEAWWQSQLASAPPAALAGPLAAAPAPAANNPSPAVPRPRAGVRARERARAGDAPSAAAAPGSSESPSAPATPRPARELPPTQAPPRRPGPPASAGQLALLRRLARGPVDVAATVASWWGCALSDLTRPEASELIDEVRELAALADRYPAAFAGDTQAAGERDPACPPNARESGGELASGSVGAQRAREGVAPVDTPAFAALLAARYGERGFNRLVRDAAVALDCDPFDAFCAWYIAQACPPAAARDKLARLAAEGWGAAGREFDPTFGSAWRPAEQPAAAGGELAARPGGTDA